MTTPLSCILVTYRLPSNTLACVQFTFQHPSEPSPGVHLRTYMEPHLLSIYVDSLSHLNCPSGAEMSCCQNKELCTMCIVLKIYLLCTCLPTHVRMYIRIYNYVLLLFSLAGWAMVLSLVRIWMWSVHHGPLTLLAEAPQLSELSSHLLTTQKTEWWTLKLLEPFCVSGLPHPPATDCLLHLPCL